MKKEYYTAIEASEYLGVNRQTIYLRQNRGELIAHIINNIKHFKKEDLDKLKIKKSYDPTVISFNNLKGGVGKSFSALFTAFVLAEKKKKVLLIDLDSQGNLSSYFLRDKVPQSSIFEVITQQANLQDTKIDVGDYISLLPSSIKLSSLENELSRKYGREVLLRRLLQDIDDKYVVIDNGPTMSIQNILSISCANIIVIPVTMQEWSIQGAERIIENIQEAKEYINPHLRKIVILSTMVRDKEILTKTYSDIIRDKYSEFKSDVSIHYRTEVGKFVAGDISINEVRNSLVYSEYKTFVDELLRK